MTSPRVLFVGCSFTANPGLANQIPTESHWTSLVTKHYHASAVNLGIGGSSNDEIFQRTVQAVTNNSYDLVVVMWSSIGRKWVYYADNNIDDYTIINAADSITGLNSGTSQVQQYAKLYYTYFNNQYVDLKFWLGQILALHGLLDSLNVKHVFIKGFDNWINDFAQVEYNQSGFQNISNGLKNILDFENNPDDRIDQKIQDIKALFPNRNLSNWVNFRGPSVNSAAIDFAPDGRHPGVESNRELSLQLIRHIGSAIG